MSDRVVISLATYNERENLERLIQDIHGSTPQVHVLVVDDNSPDGTGKLADELAARDPRIHVLHRQGKLGLGTAIIAGMNWAIDHGYDCVFSMDADFSHHPRYLPAMIAGMKKHDVMIGSRYVKGGGTANWPLKRQLTSATVNIVSRFLMRLTSRDCSGGFRCYRTSKLREANLQAIISRGYSFQEEMLLRCRQAGCKIGETPIIFEDRRFGSSKVNTHEAVRSMAIIVYLGLIAFFGWDKKY